MGDREAALAKEKELEKKKADDAANAKRLKAEEDEKAAALKRIEDEAAAKERERKAHEPPAKPTLYSVTSVPNTTNVTLKWTPCSDGALGITEDYTVVYTNENDTKPQKLHAGPELMAVIKDLQEF